MQDDATKKTDKTDRAAEKVDELAEKPISDRDAQAVKGGACKMKWESFKK